MGSYSNSFKDFAERLARNEASVGLDEIYAEESRIDREINAVASMPEEKMLEGDIPGEDHLSELLREKEEISEIIPEGSQCHDILNYKDDSPDIPEWRDNEWDGGWAMDVLDDDPIEDFDDINHYDDFEH